MTASQPYLHHVCIAVEDLDVTREFYVNVLGAVEIIRPTDFVFKGAYFTVGIADIHVVQKHRSGGGDAGLGQWSGEELSTGLVSHFAIMVDEIAPYIDRLADRGQARVGGYRVRDDYVEQAYIADPDGNIVELMQQHSEDAGRLRRQQIFDDGEAVPVAPGFPLIDPREKYGSF